MSAKSAEPEFRTGPIGEATDRSIPFGRGAGEELEHVLHLRRYLERHIHARLACKTRQLTAVVFVTRLPPADLDLLLNGSPDRQPTRWVPGYFAQLTHA